MILELQCQPYNLSTRTGMLLSSAIHTSHFVRTAVGLSGQPSAPPRALKGSVNVMNKAKLVCDSSLGLIKFLLPGCMAVSLLTAYVLASQRKGLSTTISSSWVGVFSSSRISLSHSCRLCVGVGAVTASDQCCVHCSQVQIVQDPATGGTFILKVGVFSFIHLCLSVAPELLCPSRWLGQMRVPKNRATQMCQKRFIVHKASFGCLGHLQ